MKKSLKSTMIAAAFAASTLASNAALISYDPGVAAATRGDGPFSLSNLVEVGAADVTINALGIQDLADQGQLFAPSTVTIWTGDGATVLGTVTMPVDLSGTTQIGTYRYVSLGADLVLTAGSRYIIGADVGAGIEFFFDGGSTAAPYSGSDGVTIVDSTFNGVLGAAPNASGGNPGRWGAANATFIAVPEPSSTALVGLAGITLLLRRRR